MRDKKESTLLFIERLLVFTVSNLIWRNMVLHENNNLHKSLSSYSITFREMDTYNNPTREIKTSGY